MANLNLHIDFRSETPITTQIVEQIQNRVLSGELKPGDQLPTVRQLATDLRVNFNTVARAYRILDSMGLISTQQGRGTYIWSAGQAENRERERRQAFEQLTRHYLRDALALGFSMDQIRALLETQIEQLNHTQTAED
ncbi:transcriptional regulator, GntR family [Bellilinea caldifistulae]|uniref:GntR family transcriptional regulator n=1 Tax=Bellilinea caldifistulae TaxID=360411 RepID=UPI0007843C99|nr:GntR family transcriptional regulator [Bellilinea caldifistulae]GAP09131.1 transcriptional regulator, GntR family [Bellilinea caldifistulae]